MSGNRARAAATKEADGSMAVTASEPRRWTSSAVECARPATDVQGPLTSAYARPAGEIGGQGYGETSHEPAIGIGGDVERHIGHHRRFPDGRRLR